MMRETDEDYKNREIEKKKKFFNCRVSAKVEILQLCFVDLFSTLSFPTELSESWNARGNK